MHAASLNAVEFAADLIARYEGSGPRYTSYPTADRFAEGDVLGQYLRALSLRQETRPNAPLSLYVHIPFCDTVCYYCACNKVATKDRARADQYLDYLQKEIRLVCDRFGTKPAVSQLHLGGGTPTFLTNAQLERFLRMLRDAFRFLPESECSIEIDPRRLNPGALELLAEHGFNRMSLGVQDLDPIVQRAVNRVQPAEMTEAVLRQGRQLGFRSINIDLIYGLPFQSTDTMRSTLETVLRWRPDRIALYSYAHLPERFMPQRRIDVTAVPSGATKLAMLKLAAETLLSAGYVYIGMDHFALPGDALTEALEQGSLQRNFQGYATQAECDLVALGVSAIGTVGTTYIQNYRALQDYYDALDRNELPLCKALTMTMDDEVRRAAIHDLLCQSEIQIAEFEARWKVDFAEYFEPELEQLESLAADGLVSVSESDIAITPRGRFLARIIAMCFDRYLREAKTHARYSKVI